jgi:serine/threonine protein kinase
MAILESGQIIRDTYEVERFLGEGAFAEVYRVKHRFLGRQALKIFKLPGMTTKEIEQVLNEAVILSQIGHPNIVRVFDANVMTSANGDFGFFTMEYVAGGSLDKYWQSFGRSLIPIGTTVDLVKQVCRGIAVGHFENPPIIHRDIKPQNILVGYDCEGLRARVSDFGLAKRANPLTLLASARGTLCFKAPEVFRDPMHDSCAGDVWALGCTLYLLLTDQLPFPDVMDGKLINPKLFERAIEPPGSINGECDQVLDRICLRSLAINPQDRYLNAKEMLIDLENWGPVLDRKANIYPSQTSKESLGTFSPLDEVAGRKLVSQALELAKKPNKLFQAADVMEEAFLKFPDMRVQYGDLVKLWRRGISF